MSPRRTVLRADVGATPSHPRHRTLAVRLVVVAAALAMGLSTAAAQKLQFRQLTPDQGLSSSLVQAIAQDSRGFVWLATKKGINRYDGYTFTVYRHRADDSTSLGDNDAMALYEDTQKTLWVGTTKGLTRYDREHDLFHLCHLAKCAARHLFARAHRVHVGRVEEVDSEIERPSIEGLCFRFIENPRPPFRASVAHAAKTDPGDD